MLQNSLITQMSLNKLLKKSSSSSFRLKVAKKPLLTIEQMNIIAAAKKNNHTYINRIRDKRDKNDFDVQDEKKNTALYYAVCESNIETVKALLSIGINDLH